MTSRSANGSGSRGRILASSVAVLMLALAPERSAAQPLSGDEQRCTVALDKSLAQLSGALGKDATDCIKRFQKDQLEQLGADQSVASCLLAHPKGGGANALGKLEGQFEKRCFANGVSTAPSFEPDEPLAIGYVALLQQPWLMHALFGPDLTAGLVREAQDPDAAHCQQAIATAVRNCQVALLKAFDGCKKDGLASGAIVDVAGLESCIGADPKGLVAKTCDDKLLGAIEKKCEVPGVDLTLALGGCQAASSDAAHDCVGQRARCNACLLLRSSDELGLDCDDVDDQLDNGSCGCGDGITAPTLAEECDDGNDVDGDGCTAACLLEYCGDGVVNAAPSEECDDGGNGDGDGCSESCQVESCGDGVLQTGSEVCDDGGTSGGDGCDADCTPTESNCVCDCDDGNPCTEEHCVDLPGGGCVCVITPLTNLGCDEGMAVDPATQGLCNGTVYKKAESCCVTMGMTMTLLKKNPIRKLDQCPSRVANPGWQLEYDGCTTVPNEPVKGFKFSNAAHTAPCDLHDACYQTCNSVKATCDDQFLTDMIAVCDGVPGAAAKDVAQCKKTAKNYHFGVVSFGGTAFDGRQRQVCNCCM